MESTFKEEITDKLAQILESVEVIEERCKSYQNIDDFLQTPWGMTILDACILRLQVIGETIKALTIRPDRLCLSGIRRFPGVK